jgi:hypothetical protein
MEHNPGAPDFRSMAMEATHRAKVQQRGGWPRGQTGVGASSGYNAHPQPHQTTAREQFQ